MASPPAYARRLRPSRDDRYSGFHGAVSPGTCPQAAWSRTPSEVTCLDFPGRSEKFSSRDRGRAAGGLRGVVMARWGGERRGGAAGRGGERRRGTARSAMSCCGPLTSIRPRSDALLRHVRGAGFDGVPEPLSLDPVGDERLAYIVGDVPCPPFPTWSQTDDVLASTVKLRRFHDATVGFVVPADATWKPRRWPTPMRAKVRAWRVRVLPVVCDAVICHNDVCPENVVFRAGRAVPALLDFDFGLPRGAGCSTWPACCS